jgi:hypothetical protein
VADPGSLDARTVTINWGDGGAVEVLTLAPAGTFGRSHVYATPGNYSVTAVARDDDGGERSVTQDIRVQNLVPTASSAVVNNGATQRSRVTQIAFFFSENVGQSLNVEDLALRNRSTGVDLPAGVMALAYDPISRRATLTFPGLPAQQLPDGDYRLILAAGSVADEEGAPIAAAFQVDFHALAGDVNGDRTTNDVDLYQVWQNLLKPAANRDLNADLDGDGQVTIADVNLVKAHYHAALPAVVSGLLGDVNSDGAVNDRDLFLVWQTLLKPAAQRDLQFDINGDGQVNTADFNIVKISYLTGSSPAGGAGGTSGAAAGGAESGDGTMLAPASDARQAAADPAGAVGAVPALQPAGALLQTATGVTNPSDTTMDSAVALDLRPATQPGSTSGARPEPVEGAVPAAGLRSNAIPAPLISVRANDWHWLEMDAPAWFEFGWKRSKRV